ncbi:MAG: bifunctional [glutamine synthetase] adenylyltransferase/[glutamine synthetase]-adenylyl-L-tyrosine phosphorylase [Hyphomicrobiaceae bacterium]
MSTSPTTDPRSFEPATTERAALADLIGTIPGVYDPLAAERAFADLAETIAADPALAGLATLSARPPVRALLGALFGTSPYLTTLALRSPTMLQASLAEPPAERLAALGATLEREIGAAASLPDAMRALRRYKNAAALHAALADIGGVWPIMQVTDALSTIADDALGAAVRFLLTRAARAGDCHPADPDHPAVGSGYIVIAMGKYGARELNYSSDIDLIVFFERDRLALKDGLDPQSFFVRLTRDLVRLMQERTADGYVFRTDLRLRPDPGSTQIALSTTAALHYYESFGQNWERAALIKARAAAGDIAAGEALLAELAPYVWRKYLDFAAVADIHAMKRQIHAFKGFGEIGVAGHNIKLGRGGIREIEFFAQTQQLIAGGRQKDLRVPQTLLALDRLRARNWIAPRAVEELTAAYCFLRMVEHRLQMIADEQTQTLPTEADKLARVACFAGFATAEAFGERLRAELGRVQQHYGALFEEVPELTSEGGNLVFTGDDDDPETVATLARMGYRDPAAAIATVKGWHYGRSRAMRTARARERLTEVQPALLEALARTSEPNRALASFDRFLSELPAGVQLFSLLRSNPGLLRLIVDILGTAPRLATILSRRSRLLDAVLDPGFFGTEPSEEELARRIKGEIAAAGDFQDLLDRARIVGNEQQFLIGVRVLSGTISAVRAGGAYAMLATLLIGALQDAVEKEIGRQHGLMPGGAAAVLAMGKLGGREISASSDLDLIVVYDYEGEAAQSDGRKPLPGQQYYSRITQRLVSAISSPTSEGRLYEVDMRLRPSGSSGPVASHLESFTAYHREAAWTWERMALTRARVITGPPTLRAAIEAVIREVLTTPRDAGKLTADVREMRERIAAEKGTRDIWDLKQVRGGLVDIEFIAQYLQLRHAAADPGVLSQNTLDALARLAGRGFLAPDAADRLIPAMRLYQSVSQVLSLCLEGPFDPGKAPPGLVELLVRAGEVPDLGRLGAMLIEHQGEVLDLFNRLIAD